jgi:hypothetical protein
MTEKKTIYLDTGGYHILGWILAAVYSKKKRTPWIAILCMALLLGVYAYLTPIILKITGVDWNETYAPAARALVFGHNPYQAATNLRNPVWILLPLIPISLLPQRIGTLAALFLTIAIYLFIPYKLQANLVARTAFLLSPPIILSLQMVNVDSLVLLGFLMPAPIGLFFVLAKPQIGIGIAIYWFIEAWQKGGFRKVVITFAPVTFALVVTFILYGNWINVAIDRDLVTASWNTSLFPWGIPIGLVLFFLAVRFKKKYLAASSSPFFTPYMFLPSWSAALVGFFDKDLLMVGTVLAMWIMVLIRLR